jgi:hypothetical protein
MLACWRTCARFEKFKRGGVALAKNYQQAIEQHYDVLVDPCGLRPVG